MAEYLFYIGVVIISLVFVIYYRIEFKEFMKKDEDF